MHQEKCFSSPNVKHVCPLFVCSELSLKTVHVHLSTEELPAIRRIFSLVDMITNTKFSNCPNDFKIGVV